MLGNLLSTKQLQELLNIDRTTVYRMLKDGRLNGIKVGNQWRFSREEVNALLTGRSAPVASSPPPASAPAEPFPVKCVQAMQDVFAEVLGVGVVTTAPNGEPLTELSNACHFCQLILASKSGRQACIGSWQSLAQQQNKRGFSTCHAGLRYAQAPIKVKGQFRAMLVAGQFYAELPSAAEEEARLQELAETHNISPVRLRAAAESVPVLNEHAQGHIEGWLKKEARVIEEFSNERLDMMRRFQMKTAQK
jgi:excisionase family DNA binding protein